MVLSKFCIICGRISINYNNKNLKLIELCYLLSVDIKYISTQNRYNVLYKKYHIFYKYCN